MKKINIYKFLTHNAIVIKKKYKECLAKIGKKKFYCTSLIGQSDYGITINSDLTVSCNCTDLYGFGKIGDLKKENITQILSNKKAHQFREELARGKLPIIDCVTCQNLRTTTKLKDIHQYTNPKTILLENTVNCNVNCLSCKRKDILQNRTKKSINSQEMELVAKELQRIKVKQIYYFNQGEPFLSNKIKEEIKIIKKHNPKVKLITSTNGTLINNKEKREAALMFNHIFFSIDGCDQKTAQKYQKGSDFNIAYNNMSELVKLRGKNKEPVIEWKYVLFKWNDKRKYLKKAKKLAEESKIDILSFWKTLWPADGISWRYYIGSPYFKKFGIKSWKGREIDFRKK